MSSNATSTRSTEQIHAAMAELPATDDLARWNAEMGALWREMAAAADREKAPGWAVLAAALLADKYDPRVS